MKKLIACSLILLLLTACAKPAAAPEEPNLPVVTEPVETPEPETKPEEPAEDLFVFTRENLPKLDGSTSMVPLGQALAAALLGESQSDVESLIDFHRTTESFRYLMRGESDLLLVAEPSQVVFDEMEQAGFAYEMEPIAKEALVFIVNSDNPIDSLTVEQLRDIYSGQITNWSQVGGSDVDIVPFQRNKTSGSQVLMDKLVMGELEMMQAPQEWIPGEMDTLMQGVRGYEDSAAAIGYSVYYYAEDMRMAEGMKILSVEGVEPTDETIFADEYPLINPYFAVIDAETEADSPTRILFDWIRSSDGQMVLESQGYVPVGTAGELENPVYMDVSGLTGFEQPMEIFTRRSEERMEDLLPGDYGLLRPYVGSRAAFDMTIYGSSGIYNGYKGLIDETGAIVVDPVYTDVSVLYDWNTDAALPIYCLSKEAWIDSDWGGYMGQTYGFCSLDGTVAEPCIYEQVTCSNGYIVAMVDASDGLFRIFDGRGDLLLDTADWPQRPEIYLEMGAGIVDVSEHLLVISVVLDAESWDVARWLYDWDGNRLSAQYDYISLHGEAPYVCGTWDSSISGYIDAHGKPVAIHDGASAGVFYDGQALVTIDGTYHVMDPEGNILWSPSVGSMSYEYSGGQLYYCRSSDADSFKMEYYDRNFRQMYPDTDYVRHIHGNLFLIWNHGICTLTDGNHFIELGELSPVMNYYSQVSGNLVLLTHYLDQKQEYWLLDQQLNLLSHGEAEGISLELREDWLTGEAVAVWCDVGGYASYPYVYHAVDYPGAPKLADVNVLGIYNGWYMVEDEFTAGYMDENGTWLFRVNLMTDMTD